MKTTSTLAALAFAVAGLLHAAVASAQQFPSKPIRFIIGPAPDVLARLVGQKLSDAWGQQVVIDQRPGAGGILAAETVAKAPPAPATAEPKASARPKAGAKPKTAKSKAARSKARTTGAAGTTSSEAGETESAVERS